MTGRPVTDERMVRYLLGELEPDEQAELDERAFVDDAWEAERDTAADELIEAYLTDALRPDQRQHFEVHFLASAAHRERFQLMRDLRTALARRAAVTPSAAAPVRRSFVWAAAAAALLAALAALALYARSPAPDPLIAVVTPAPAPTATPEAPPATPTPRPSPRGPAEVTLPNRPRPVELELGDVRSVRFAVPVPEEGPPSYAAVVRRDRETVWRRDDLVPAEAGAPLVVTVPADVLDGDVTFEIQPEAVRSASPAPAPVTRVWALRIVRN
ncbi:MAG: hypothetical protein ABW221_08490 [Vicinamibacteria bacterium]